MTKLTKLSSNDVEFKKLKRAKNDGDQPSVTFRVKNGANVDKFISDTEQLGLLWTDLLKDANGRQTLRLRYEYNADKTEITFARNVTPNTIVQASNQTLANAVLTCIIDATVKDINDIFTGLTSIHHSKYQPSAVSLKIFNDHYETESARNQPIFN